MHQREQEFSVQFRTRPATKFSLDSILLPFKNAFACLLFRLPIDLSGQTPSVGMYFHLCARTSFHWTEKIHIYTRARKEAGFRAGEVCGARLCFDGKGCSFGSHGNILIQFLMFHSRAGKFEINPTHSLPWTRFYYFSQPNNELAVHPQK